VWDPNDPQGAESLKVRHLIVPYTRGKGLDIGCGPWKAFPHFIGVDNHDEWSGWDWHPDVEADADDLKMFADNALDFVFSSHTLEHVEDPFRHLKEWWRVIKPGGHLVLYLPDKDYYPNMGEPGANPDHKSDFYREDIIAMMQKIGRHWIIRESERRNERQEYSFLLVFEKAKQGKHQVQLARATDGSQSCLVIRYGGFGDMIQTASIFPQLKAQGYHITLQTTPRGAEAVLNDPNIDRIQLQDKDQVPNTELQEYWVALGNEYDRVINLSESVEVTLLAIPGRRRHAMTKAARHATMNVNYIEMQHMLADVPLDPQARFYPTEKERRRAQHIIDSDIGPRPAIMWALAGSSSVHKAWPWVAEAMQLVIDHTNAAVFLVGGPETEILEHAILQTLAGQYIGMPYEQSNELTPNELREAFPQGGRVFPLCGQNGIRDALALAQLCDVVVGPETGVLNAVGQDEDVHKVVMLSHSSPENLTKHWVNVSAIEPVDVDCYPCHRMHYDDTWCPRDKETGASACAASINALTIFGAIQKGLAAWPSTTKRSLAPKEKTAQSGSG
jgi:ADP-heptose:LPS heptosyltransferase/predicted SAM-dependent methyltransferase